MIDATRCFLMIPHAGHLYPPSTPRQAPAARRPHSAQAVLAARRRRTAETRHKRNSSRAVHARDGLAPPAASASPPAPAPAAAPVPAAACSAANTHPSDKFGSLILGGRGRFPVVGTLGQRPITFPATSRALMLSYSRAYCCSAGLVRRRASGPVGIVTFPALPPALGLPAPSATHLALLALLAHLSSHLHCTPAYDILPFCSIPASGSKSKKDRSFTTAVPGTLAFALGSSGLNPDRQHAPGHHGQDQNQDQDQAAWAPLPELGCCCLGALPCRLRLRCESLLGLRL